MTGQAGALVVFGAGVRPAGVLLAAAPWLPSGWPVHVRPTPWGSALIAGRAARTAGDRVVVGTAVSEPWGLPGRELAVEEILALWDRYGDHVIELAAGPFLVADLHTGVAARALNGIVPLFAAHGCRTALGTHPGLVAALAGAGEAHPVPPGAVVAVAGSVTQVAHPSIPEATPTSRLADLHNDLDERIRRCGHVSPVPPQFLYAVSGHASLTRVGAAIIASPRRGMRAGPATGHTHGDLAGLRDAVGRLWWQAGLRHASVFVPVLERPSLDALAAAMAAT